MNWRQIGTLFRINLLYANPQLTQRRRKRHPGGSITGGLLAQYILIGCVFLVIFGFSMVKINFVYYPGYFTMYCAAFTLMGFSQSLGMIFNIFYESKDLKDYLPLPISNSTIFGSKFLTIILGVFPFLLPLLGLFIMTGVRSSAPYAVVGVVVFLIYMACVLALGVWIVSLLVQSKLFQKFKNVGTTIFLVLPIALFLLSYLFIDREQAKALSNGVILTDKSVIVFLKPVFTLATKPFSLGGLEGLAGLIVILVLLCLVIFRRIIPKMFQLMLEEEGGHGYAKKKTRKVAAAGSVSHQLFRYNMSIVKNPSAWMQTLTMVFIMPIVLIASVLGSGRQATHAISTVSPRYFALFVIAGAAFALITITVTSIVGIIISLDRESFSYFLSLPVNFREYMRVKFRFACGIQWAIDFVVLVIVAVLLRVPVPYILAAVVGNAFTVILISMFYFARDYRLLNLTWNNINELYTRGIGTWFVALMMWGGLIASAAVGVGTWLALRFLPAPIVWNVVILAVLALAGGLMWRHYRKNFWAIFEKA